MIPYDVNPISYIALFITIMAAIVFMTSLINPRNRHFITYLAIFCTVMFSIIGASICFCGESYNTTIKICNIVSNGNNGVTILDYDGNTYTAHDTETTIWFKQDHTYDVGVVVSPISPKIIYKVYQSDFVCNGVDNC